MFEGFALDDVELEGARLRVRHGGSGPPVLLLHGHPRTHTTWHRVAPLLAARHTVVCPDLPGFGRSSKPAPTRDHVNSSKRAKARHCVELMRRLGHSRFAVVGHDRGAYTAFRAAMDYPEAATRLAVLDAVPILEALERCDRRFASAWWHWFFFAQPDKPEQAILADPDAWYGGSPEQMGEENYADYRPAIHDPETVTGMLDDYRAGLAADPADDAEDRRAGRRVECPTLVLRSRRDDLEQLYGDVLEVWRPWTTALSGRGLDCGHHMAEEAPGELAEELLEFLSGLPEAASEPGIHIRLACLSDLPAIQRIVQAAYSRYVDRIGKPPGPMLDDYGARVREHTAWVAEHGGEVAGLVVLLAGDGHLLLANVAVEPALHRRGIGRELMGFAERLAVRRGLRELRLYTHTAMHENIAMYAARGWTETARAEQAGYARVFFRKYV